MASQRFLKGLTFLLLCNIMIVFDSTAADTVHRMSKLFSFSGWRGLYPLEILEHSNKDDTVVKVQVNSLLSSAIIDTDGQKNSVTATNVDDKIRQAHQFLSCQYAIVLLTYEKYLNRLGRKCCLLRDDTHVDYTNKRDCKQKFGQIFESKILISCMQSALFYFTSLSPNAKFTNDVFDLLTKLGDTYYRKKGVYTIQRIQESVNMLDELKTSACDYFKSHCGPESHLIERKFGSSTYSWVSKKLSLMFYKRTNDADEINKLYKMVNKTIEEFLVLDYTLLGFQLNTRLNITVLNENTESPNELLKQTAGWLDYLRKLSSMVDNQQQGVENQLAAKVDEAKLGQKFRVVYDLMSCYYVEILKELLSYNQSIAGFFDSGSSKDKLEFFKSFVRTVKKSLPVIVYMKAAIFYFQRLTPQTSGVFITKVLTFFENSLEIINVYAIDVYTGYELSDDKLLDQMEILLEKLSKIEKELNTYSQTVCVVPAKFTNIVVLKNTRAVIEDQLNKKIELILSTVYPDLGPRFTV